MENMENFLPGIKKIEFAKAEQVAVESVECLTAGKPVIVYGNFFSIRIEGLASVSLESASVNGQYLYSSSLKFRAGEQQAGDYPLRVVLPNGNFVYRLTDVTGARYLVGHNKKPYPAAKIIQTIPSAQNEPAIHEYEINCANTFGILTIN